MKKAATIGAALLGLLFVGAATQEPQAPTSFRDVLRGRVGQQCDAGLTDGIWTLSFPAGAREPRDEVSEEIINSIRQALPSLELPGALSDWSEAIREREVRTLVEVGEDFVRLRKGNDTENFVPLSRVDVVVVPVK